MPYEHLSSGAHAVTYTAGLPSGTTGAALGDYQHRYPSANAGIVAAGANDPLRDYHQMYADMYGPSAAQPGAGRGPIGGHVTAERSAGRGDALREYQHHPEHRQSEQAYQQALEQYRSAYGIYGAGNPPHQTTQTAHGAASAPASHQAHYPAVSNFGAGAYGDRGCHPSTRNLAGLLPRQGETVRSALEPTPDDTPVGVKRARAACCALPRVR